MNKGRVMLLVDALESGEFSQTRGLLKLENRYCATGVACELFRRHTGRGQWVPSFRIGEFELLGEVFMVSAPPGVREWYGGDDPDAGRWFSGVAHLNDDGKHFRTIAWAMRADVVPIISGTPS